MSSIIGPQPGPQSQACTSKAEIIIYGGAAGGGKSWLMNYMFATMAYMYAGFGGAILSSRRRLAIRPNPRQSYPGGPKPPPT